MPVSLQLVLGRPHARSRHLRLMCLCRSNRAARTCCCVSPPAQRHAWLVRVSMRSQPLPACPFRQHMLAQTRGSGRGRSDRRAGRVAMTVTGWAARGARPATSCRRASGRTRPAAPSGPRICRLHRITAVAQMALGGRGAIGLERR